jgi:hypothetical protein
LHFASELRGARTLITEEDDRKIQALMKPLARKQPEGGGQS